MENLISLVNKLQRACTVLGDHGEESTLPTLWDSLPAIAVVGGQVGLLLPSPFLDLSFWSRRFIFLQLSLLQIIDLASFCFLIFSRSEQKSSIFRICLDLWLCFLSVQSARVWGLFLLLLDAVLFALVSDLIFFFFFDCASDLSICL